MLIKIFLALAGLASGVAVSAGIFAFILSLGVIERMADVTGTAAHLKIYESAIFFGAIFGNLLSVYEFKLNFGVVGSAVFGLSSGFFVGIMAIALVELLKAVPIMLRRLRIRKGLGIIVLSIALGKLVGSLIQFFKGWTV